MRSDRASALGAFIQLRGHPAMRGLARAQAHLGGFAFWNSHTSGLGKQEISETQILELQFIQSAPIRRSHREAFRLFRRLRRRGWTSASALAVTVRIGRQIQQDVFANERRQVDRLRSTKLGVQSEIPDFDDVGELLQTGHANHLDWLRERAVSPERTVGDTDIERIAQWSRADGAFFRQLRDGAFLLAFEVETLGSDLSEMNFHDLNFLVKAVATGGGTNFAMSPPRRAISFTILELK